MAMLPAGAVQGKEDWLGQVAQGDAAGCNIAAFSGKNKFARRQFARRQSQRDFLGN
jgi:hypothetical protein